MENASNESQWVASQTAYLDPPAGWQADPAAALRRFHMRQQANRPRASWRRWTTWAAAAALAAGIVLLLPAARVAAQQLWQFLTVRQVAFVRVKEWPEGVPSPQVKIIGAVIPPLPAGDLDQVRWRVHYEPRLPRPGVLSGSPRLSTTFPVSAGTLIHAADLQLALNKAGVAGETVPAQWEGAQLALHTSAVAIAEWPDIVLVQSLPLTLTAPSNFDFSAFSALVLRVLGVGPDEARRLAQRMGTVPPWLAPIGENLRQGGMEEITLNSGPATLFRETGRDGGVWRTSVIWSVPDRVYVLSGKLSRELTISAANAVQ
jgi:hypothetical protein